MRPWRKLVNQPRQDFFAGSALPEQKHGNIDVRHQGSLGTDLAHGRTGRDEKDVVGKLFDFAAERLFALAEAEVEDGVEFGFLKRLGQIILRAELHRLHNLARIVDAGKHHDLRAGLHLAELFERLQTVDAGHQHVEQHQIRLQTLFDALQRFFAGRRRFDFVVIDFEQRLNVAQHAWFIVYQKNFCGLLHLVVLPLLATTEAGL